MANNVLFLLLGKKRNNPLEEEDAEMNEQKTLEDVVDMIAEGRLRRPHKIKQKMNNLLIDIT